MKVRGLVGVRQLCSNGDVVRVEALSKEILADLSAKGKADFFGGVSKSEIRRASAPLSAIVFLTFCGDELIGFLLLEEPSKEEIEKCKENFGWIDETKVIVLNGYGVKPKWQGKGISHVLLDKAKEHMIEMGKQYVIGTVHPQNEPSRRALQHMAENFREGETYIHQMNDGRKLPRVPFLVEINH